MKPHGISSGIRWCEVGHSMKLEIQGYHRPIYMCGLPKEQEAIIWDFYVTHAIAASASQGRKASDYELSSLPWDEMKRVAGIDSSNVKILLANSINKTLTKFDLEVAKGKAEHKRFMAIEVDIPKIVCSTPYSIADEEPPKGKVGEAESVLTHIRNSLAHGLTYFFDNGNVLFEDRDPRGTITARIILKIQTLLDWIALIDKNQKYYVLHKQ